MCAFWKFKAALFALCVLCVVVEKREKEKNREELPAERV